MEERNVDPYFKVKVIAQTPRPQTVIYAAMHQDYAEEFVADHAHQWPDEEGCGKLIVKCLLAGNRGHYGPLEHPQITLNCGWFPHSTMQQIRTHRVGISIDCQSFRYTGSRIIEVVDGKRDIEEVFYLRPLGKYTDRKGEAYYYDEILRNAHLSRVRFAAECYKEDIWNGLSEEHARGLIPFDVRQHWVISLNVRSLMHLLLIRGKKDAQLECQQLCELILPHFEAWCPQIYEWFMNNLWLKGRLAP